tara:strand:+ start:6346 stop:6660 length:315 start_codon:yes stop_codon:yes gene_type:complete
MYDEGIAKMESMANTKARQTLLNAYETLQEKANQLKGLQKLSEKLNEKFERTEGMVKGIDDSIKEPNSVKQPNLIELFMDLSYQMQSSINEIGNNTERVLQMID